MMEPLTRSCHAVTQKCIRRGVVLMLLMHGVTLVPATNSYQEPPRSNNALLIFLDDSETALNAISSGLLSALVNEDGPLIASASLVHLVSQSNKYGGVPLQELTKRYQALKKMQYESKEFDLTTIHLDPNYLEERSIELSLASFTHEQADKWVIKEVNPFLYLLLPKKYLAVKNIDAAAVELFAVDGPVTLAEHVLGLHVNHMRTVTIADVKKPEPEPAHADYFVRSLDALFVLNSQYPAEYKRFIPTWSFFVHGHGDMNESIVGLTLGGFKTLLTFLETKIRTRALIYSSCYGAGNNAEIIYKDAQRGIDATYPFTIVTLALTDAATLTAFGIDFDVESGVIKVKFRHNFNEFLKQITAPDVVDYVHAIESIVNVAPGFMNWPQIKYPGLPWFSVIDSANKVVAIGSVMAKTRTAPLDIATFFAKRGKKSEPLAILLYAQDIPFEIVVNTKTNPTFVSMIPGNAVHYIKKISSVNKNIDVLMRSFFIPTLAPHKQFVIDELQGLLPFTVFPFTTDRLLGTKQGMLSTLFIDVTHDAITEFFTYKDRLYTGNGLDFKLITPSDVELQNNYMRLIQQYARAIPATKKAEIKYAQEEKKEAEQAKRTAERVALNPEERAAQAALIKSFSGDIKTFMAALQEVRSRTALQEALTEFNQFLIRQQFRSLSPEQQDLSNQMQKLLQEKIASFAPAFSNAA